MTDRKVPRPSTNRNASASDDSASDQAHSPTLGGSAGRSSLGTAHDAAEIDRLLIAAVRDYAIFALDPDGFILSWNAGAEALKGYTAEEAIGQHFSIFYPRDVVAEGFPAFELRTAANTGRFENEGWRVRKNGTRFWANVIITALRDGSGTLIGFAKVTRDLTERREVEEALRESEERFRLLVQGVKDYAIFMLDPYGLVKTWNEGAERIKGYRADEIIGQSFSKFYLPEDIASRKPERELEIAKRVGQYAEEGWRLRRDGTTFWASVLITALRKPGGELIGFAKVTRDLTERRAAEQRALEHARDSATQEAMTHASAEREQELRDLASKLLAQTAELRQRSRDAEDARRLADEANRIKSQFLAAMSHELRTPLNAIGGYADLLIMGLSGNVTPQQTEQLGRIKRSQVHLLGIINDILNFARVDAGQLTYDLGQVPLHSIVDAVIHMMAPQAHATDVRLERRDCAEDAVAWADSAKVEQIVLNLVSNAVKFTEPGGRIELSCGRADDAHVTLAVRDTGCGIPDEHLKAIFEPFVQVGRTLTATRQGTGLGLAISRDLARAMQGELAVESVVDQGSTFTLTLPTSRENATTA